MRIGIDMRLIVSAAVVEKHTSPVSRHFSVVTLARSGQTGAKPVAVRLYDSQTWASQIPFWNGTARGLGQSFSRKIRANHLISLATPAGLKPATNSLEGPWSSNDFNARSDIFTVRAPFDAIAEFRFVGTPTSRLPPLNARRRRARRSRRLGGSTSSLQFAGAAS